MVAQKTMMIEMGMEVEMRVLLFVVAGVVAAMKRPLDGTEYRNKPQMLPGLTGNISQPSWIGIYPFPSVS